MPFKQFCKQWVTKKPPANIPFYGSWDDSKLIYGGSPEETMTPDTMRSITMPHPKDVRIEALEAELEAAQKKLARSAKAKAAPKAKAKAKAAPKAKVKAKAALKAKAKAARKGRKKSR
jgi:hypothetical protein